MLAILNNISNMWMNANTCQYLLLNNLLWHSLKQTEFKIEIHNLHCLKFKLWLKLYKELRIKYSNDLLYEQKIKNSVEFDQSWSRDWTRLVVFWSGSYNSIILTKRELNWTNLKWRSDDPLHRAGPDLSPVCLWAHRSCPPSVPPRRRRTRGWGWCRTAWCSRPAWRTLSSSPADFGWLDMGCVGRRSCRQQFGELEVRWWVVRSCCGQIGDEVRSRRELLVSRGSEHVRELTETVRRLGGGDQNWEVTPARDSQPRPAEISIVPHNYGNRKFVLQVLTSYQ